MSLFKWLSREKQKPGAEAPAPARADAGRAAAAPAAGSRKGDRIARRELLYSVVRESMARAGILSASYRFKVLSLDATGRQFLVMVDLASSERADPDLLADIEAVIAQRARSRHELVVTAVYWRRSDALGGGPASRAAPRHAPAAGALAAAPSQPAELLSEPMPLPAAAAGAAVPAAAVGIDPIQEEELEALRAALAGGPGAAPAAAPSPPARPTAAARPTGFQDTVARRDDERRSRTLSSTQAGDLS